MAKETYYPELDGVRALAVLLVILYHLGLPWIKGGFIGVDVFFVLSGYLISKNLFQQHSEGRFSFLQFYQRRFFRLFPAIIIVVLGTLFAGIFLLPTGPLLKLGESSLWAIFSLANFYSFSQSGYWDQSSVSQPLLHFWSLAVEEQFYLLWPLLIWLIFRFKKGQQKFFIAFFAGLALLAFVATEIFLRFNPQAAFYMMPLRSWEFALGALTALLYKPEVHFKDKMKSTVLSLVGLFLCLGCAWKFSSMTRFPGISALLPCIATVLFIVATPHSWIRPLFTNPVSRYLGQISYSLYLVHWPLIVFAKDFKFNFTPLLSLESAIAFTSKELALLGVLILALAISLKVFIEDPLRYQKWTLSHLQSNRMKAFVAASIVSILLSLVCFKTGGLPFRADPELYKQGMLGQYYAPCRYYYNDPELAPGCGIGVEKTAPDIILLGDSHMDHYMLGFDETLKELNLAGLLIAGGGTLPIPHGHTLVLGKKQAPFEQIYNYILKSPPKLLILSGRWDSHLNETLVDNPNVQLNRFMYGPYQSLDVKSSTNAVRAGLKDFLTTLNEKNIETILLGQIPLAGRTVKDCLMRPEYFRAKMEICLGVDRAQQIVFHQKAKNLLLEVSAPLPHIHFVEMVPRLCQKARCEVTHPENGSVLYRDGNHLSSEGGLYVVQTYIRPELERIIKEFTKD